MDTWGGILGIVATIIVGILAAAIPSRVDAKVEDLVERMQQPLLDFPAIYARTFDLLNSIREEPGSMFIMTSATPVFGIELDKSERVKWTTALNQRIVTKSSRAPLTTVLYCLSPYSPGGATASPLWEFCQELEGSGYLKEKEVRTAGDLFMRSTEALENFGDLAIKSNSEGFELRCGPTPPIHFVLARNAKGESTGILYFQGVKSPKEGLVVPGFETTDERWLELINVVNHFIKSQSPDVLPAFRIDPRTDEQKKRCNELMKYQLRQDHRSPYEHTVGGYEILVNQDVFPPEIGIGTTQLIEALKKIGTTVKDRRPIGIDVGTGTGILALVLAEYCSEVYATDISPAAEVNALENARRAFRLSGDTNGVIRVFRGNLLEPIRGLDRSRIYVVVFNYPFYPSPLAVYNPLGAEKAGMPIVREFFDQLDNLGDRIIVVMPYSSIAGIHDPRTVADEKKFRSVRLQTNENASVYAFTRSETLEELLGRLNTAP